MVAALRALQLLAETRSDYHTFEREIFLKKFLLLTSLVCTVGMIGFFVEHRLLCHDLGKIYSMGKSDVVARSRVLLANHNFIYDKKNDY